jgi:omega-6 fatty acid desaturase (delta-12 desaturase)
MTQDQVFVPPTRSDRRLPPLDPTREDALGSSVSDEVKKELWEALGDSPVGAALRAASYLVSLTTYLILHSLTYRRKLDRRVVILYHH